MRRRAFSSDAEDFVAVLKLADSHGERCMVNMTTYPDPARRQARKPDSGAAFCPFCLRRPAGRSAPHSPTVSLANIRESRASACPPRVALPLPRLAPREGSHHGHSLAFGPEEA